MRDDDEKRVLIARLEQGEGAVEEAEQWIARLHEIDPLFSSSDYLLGLERNVKARRLADRLANEISDPPSREQLVDFARKLQHGEGTDVEGEAWLLLLRSPTSSSIPRRY